MRRIAALALACVLALSIVSCAQKTENAPTWQEQYDLGLRYLEEGNYEEAIIAFTAAIEIDPKRAEAYIGLADSYTGLGDTEQARQVLEKAVELLGELSALMDKLALLADGGIKAADGGPEVEGDKIPAEVSGTLSISDLVCIYEPGTVVAGAETMAGVVGGIRLRCTVDGPANAADMNIRMSWRDPYTQEWIDQEIAEAVAEWKAFPPSKQAVPFQWEMVWPIMEEDRGETVYALLIGLDENAEAVGYAVVAVDVP